MKACEEYVALMMLSMDGEASQEELNALHDHLEKCDACRALYERYLEIDAAISETEVEPPDQLHAAIMNSIHRERARNQSAQWLKRYRFTAVAAVLALVVLVGAKVTMNVSQEDSGAAVAEDMIAAEEELEPQEAPMMAALQEAPAAPAEDGVAEAAAEAVEAPAQTPGPVESPETQTTAKASAEQMADAASGITAGETELGSGGDGTSFLTCTEAVRKAGYSGRVLYIKNASREDLERAFPDMTEIVLEDGIVIYEIKESELETAETQFDVASDYSSESDADGRYFIYLAK